MKIRYFVAMLVTAVALCAQSRTPSLEVVHADTPFGNGRTIAGTVKNVSGSTITGDIEVVVFVFGQQGIFLGGARHDQGPPPDQHLNSVLYQCQVRRTGDDQVLYAVRHCK